MVIHVRCPNIVRFDKEAGKYVRCGTQIEADESHIGSTVTCPRCGTAVEVVAPEPNIQPTVDDATTDDLFTPPTSSAAREVRSSSAPDSQNLQPPAISGHQLAVGSYCPGCGAPFPAQALQCAACGYHKSLNRRTAAFDDSVDEPQATGFALWFSQLLARDESTESFVRMALILVGLLAVSFIAGLFIVLGYWALLLVCPLVVGALVAAAAYSAAKKRGAAAPRRPFWIELPWVALLVLARLSSWRQMNWPFAERQVIDRRDQQFSDDDLIRLDGLPDCQVLELERTQITDVGLSYLLGLPNLQFLVVRHTQVTPQGVHRLQRAMPKLWIWD